MTLYVVTSGCYSDYRIHGIYSTKEKAEEARTVYDSDNDIEEYELDEIPEHPPGLLLYRVIMDSEGSISELRREGFYGGPPEEKWVPYDNERVVFMVWATNEEHAAKIANETREQLIASRKWTTNMVEFYKNL